MRICQSCGFENAGDGQACPLCGAGHLPDELPDGSLVDPLGEPGFGGRGWVAAGSTRKRHGCVKCHQPYDVIYASRHGESTLTMPVACPHCWHLNQVPVGEEAAATEDYRAQKAESTWPPQTAPSMRPRKLD